MKKYYRLIFIILFLLIFILLAIGLMADSLNTLDQSIYNYISLFINPFWTYFFKIITNFANSINLIIICFLFFVLFRHKSYIYYVYINLANVMILNIILKEIFARARPGDIMLIRETGYSFPSGHSMAAMTFYGFLIYLINRTNWKKNIKIILSILMYSLIILIGISRIYLGVHYASDVIAGFSVSLAYLIIFTIVIEKHIGGINEKK